MKIEIKLDKKVTKWLDKLEKSDKKAQIAIDYYLNEKLQTAPDPRTLGRKVQSFSDDRWRWRVGVYRLIGLVSQKGENCTIQIIKIAKKGDKTYKTTTKRLAPDRASYAPIAFYTFISSLKS